MVAPGSATEVACDVVIAGAGPEMLDKPNMATYGRATTLWPRSLELLDALDLLDPMLEAGVISRNGVNFKDGKIVNGGLVFGHRMDKHGDTRFKFAFHLRQKETEQCIVESYEALGNQVHFGHELVSFEQDVVGESPVRCIVRKADGTLLSVACKFVVGADGGRSKVRKLAGIEFVGESLGAKWIRMDSPTHGLVLFAPIDAGTTRIGFVLPADLVEQCGEKGVTPELAMAEAQKAVKPFSLEFVRVDWVTLYGIGQRLASSFVKNRIILAGDSAHTHSSGSAQGLNTGIHDAANLGWKLALTLKGLSKPELLHTYNEERRASVQTVIDNDVIIASLVSGRRPPQLAHRPEEPRDLLDEWFTNRSKVEFTVGIGISYPRNNLLNVHDEESTCATMIPGQRGPDVELSRIGTGETVWLQRILNNDGRFSIVTFASRHAVENLQTFTHYLRSQESFTNKFVGKSIRLFRFVTIIAGEGNGAEELLGARPIGMPYFDPQRVAHDVYGIDTLKGAIVVFRPDGIVAACLALSDFAILDDYFSRFLERKESIALS
ncbi:hypothetical protein OIO90_001106 [Microbotryomycetes sp. JL221]|nr:hypothetical protein OIO90_001106 [Microbotryomycetes sp. JL221]